MRKGFDGLCGIVSGQLGRNTMSGDVFIFVNRPRNKIKLLRWETGGFILYYKRLESGTFKVDFASESSSTQMSWSALVLLIEGIQVEKYVQRKRFSINTR